MKKILNNYKGITLIALVITIVVLIILAGVIISITLGNGGIIDRAKTAKQEYVNAQSKEETDINKITDEIDVISNGGTLSAEDIAFTPTDPNWTGITNVKQALDYLYQN